MIKLQELLIWNILVGPKVDKLAKQGKNNIELPKSHVEGLDFSFSGIKTAVLNLNHNRKDIKKEDLCASFESTVADMLIENTKNALYKTNLKKVALAGRSFSKFIYKRKIFRTWKRRKCKSIFSRHKVMYR